MTTSSTSPISTLFTTISSIHIMKKKKLDTQENTKLWNSSSKTTIGQKSENMLQNSQKRVLPVNEQKSSQQVNPDYSSQTKPQPILGESFLMI
jgi:hypothetical protein